MLTYEVEMAGGYGEKAWSRMVTIKAENFEDAVARAKAQFGPRGEWDFVRIEQLQ